MMLRPRILFPLLVVLALPLLGQSEVSEFPVSERELAPMLAYARGVAGVATDDGFLVLWQTKATTEVVRLSREGEIEQRVRIPALQIEWESAASNGKTVLLAGSCPGRVLCYARFSAAGDFLGVTPLPVSQPIAPGVATNGEDFLITLSTNDTRQAIAVRVAADGTPADPMVLGAWDMDTHWTSAAAIGDDWFATFGSPGGQRRLVRISDSGIAAAVDVAPPLSWWHQMRIESSGDRILVVVPGIEVALFAIYDAALAQTVPWTPLDGSSANPAIRATDAGWLVLTRRGDGGGATLQAIGRGGERGPVQTRAGGFGGLTVNGDRILMLTGSEIPGGIDKGTAVGGSSVRASILDLRGATVRSAEIVSLADAAQIQPAAVESNGVVLVAWTELGMDERFLVKARAFDLAGVPLAPAVAMPASEESQWMPALASNGDSFLVLWSEGPWGTGQTAIKGARISLSGRLLDDVAIPLFGYGYLPLGRVRTADVAWSGSAWIVVSSDEKGRIVARRVSPGGVVLDSSPAEITHLSQWGSAADFAPAIDCNGSECLVAWHGPTRSPNCTRWGCAWPVALYASRISPELTLLAGPAAELTNPGEEITDPRRTTVVWNEVAGSWLVAWSFTGRQRVARDGRLLDPLATSNNQDGVIVSAIHEREGWRLAWSSGGDVFHGWSRTGRAADVEERFALTARPEQETDAQLVNATRPLAFFVRESSPGSPEVIGRFLDASSAALAPRLELSVTRISDKQVRLSWYGNLEDVTAFRIYRWNGAWQQTQSAGASESGIALDLAEGRGARFLVRAETQSGPVESNVVEIEGDRRRTAVR